MVSIKVEVPGHVPNAVGVGKGGSWVCGFRNSPSVQSGTLAEKKALLTPEEGGKGMCKSQPYPGDSSFPSFCLSPSPFFEAGYPVHITPGPPQGSIEVGAAASGGLRRPGQGRLLKGAWWDTLKGLLTGARLEGTRKSWLCILQVFIRHLPRTRLCARQRVTGVNCTDVGPVYGVQSIEWW